MQEPQDIAALAVPRKSEISVLGQKPDGGKAVFFEKERDFTARSLLVDGKMKGKLYAVKDGKRELIADIDTGGRDETTDFMPDGVEVFSFKEATATQFVLEPCDLPGDKVQLCSAPKVAQVVEKQLGRTAAEELGWENSVYPVTVQPDDVSLVLKQDEIIDLTAKLGKDGVLNCELPPGDWTILYFGMISTGKEVHPAPSEAAGLEVDKLSRALVNYHFNSMFGKLLAELSPDERAAFKGITIDSFEKGSQNWTANFMELFEKKNGYSPLQFMPVFTGRIVGSADASDNFLWDLRRTVADTVATEFVGGLRDIANRNGLKLWCENYGFYGFPGEFLVHGGQADEIAGEFWTNFGPAEKNYNLSCRAASSAVHIYGKRTVYAEAFTSMLDLGHHPYVIKAKGDEAFCRGINHFVLSVYSSQPRDDMPGKNPWYGTAFHRNTPWFNHSGAWVKYLERCHYMLGEGRPAADVAVYIGDFAPQFTGPANPVPAGYDFDYMGSDALLRTVKPKDGDLVVNDEVKPRRVAARYKVLAANETAMKRLRPKVRERFDALAKAGVKIVDTVPVSEEALRKLGIAPMVADSSCPIQWTARQLDGNDENRKLFYISNFAKTGPFEVTLRTQGKAPELFNPVTGEVRKLARFWKDGEGTRVAFTVRDRSESFFLVFRDKPKAASVLKVQSNGKDVSATDMDLWFDARGRLMCRTLLPGTYTLRMSDGSERKVLLDGEVPSLEVTTPWETVEEQDEGFTVVRRTEFNLPEGFGKGRRILLNLSDVQVMAEVSLNGKTYDTLWMPPFELDVTDAIKAGTNKLSVVVTSTSKGKPTLGKVTVRTVFGQVVLE